MSDVNEFDKQVGDRLRDLRELKGLTQLRMADKLYLSLSSYQRRESGQVKVTLSELARLHELFDIDVMEFVFGKTKESVKEKIILEKLEEVEKTLGEVKRIQLSQM